MESLEWEGLCEALFWPAQSTVSFGIRACHSELLQSGSENLEGWIVYALSKQFVSLLDFSAAKKLFLFAWWEPFLLHFLTVVACLPTVCCCNKSPIGEVFPAPVCAEPEPVTVFQIQANKCWVGEDNPPPWCTGCVTLVQARLLMTCSARTPRCLPWLCWYSPQNKGPTSLQPVGAGICYSAMAQVFVHFEMGVSC